MAGANAYVFDVSSGANKTEVQKAVFEIYKVKPIKVNIMAVPKKTVFSRGVSGSKAGGKKAVVYLKEGDKIEFV